MPAWSIISASDQIGRSNTTTVLNTSVHHTNSSSSKTHHRLNILHHFLHPTTSFRAHRPDVRLSEPSAQSRLQAGHQRSHRRRSLSATQHCAVIYLLAIKQSHFPSSPAFAHAVFSSFRLLVSLLDQDGSTKSFRSTGAPWLSTIPSTAAATAATLQYSSSCVPAESRPESSCSVCQASPTKRQQHFKHH